MSLIRQIWLLLLVTLLMAFLGSFAVWMLSSRGYLETQLRLKNADNAQSLALNLTQQRGDTMGMDLALSAMFDTGSYQRITLKDAAGRVLANRAADPSVTREQAPAWFVELVPVESVPGVAQVSDGWRAVGSVEVVSHSAFAHAQLWQGSMKTAGLLTLLGALACVVATFGVNGIRKPLNATVSQARALMERRFVTVVEPRVPELAQLSQAMNAVVLRMKSVFEEQAGQVELLRQQAHCDPLTGLSHRRHFMAQLGAALSSEEGSGDGVIYLIRISDLAGINRLLGHRQTDVLLQRLARVLTEESAGVPGAAMGRLNGGDFAVCLMSSHVPLPQAEHYADALKRAFTEQAVPAAVVVGGVRWKRGVTMQSVLAAADSALARAESRGAFSVELSALADAQAVVLGEDEWRRRLGNALQTGRAQLMRYPVVDRQLKLLHHECPMRLQLEADGPFETAAMWLPMALRTGLISQIDEAAVSLALAQIAQDQQPRGVNIAPNSLLDSGFVPRLRALLAAKPEAARLLWLEVAEAAAVERFELVRELCKQLRPLGARVGLEHAGDRLTRIESLFEAGLDYVKLDASVVQGVANDAARAAFVSGTVNMLHGLGLQVYGEGVNEPADILALRQCGIDGVTGPAVRVA
ncbi:diguanylate cyclase/phosphodiesterase [Aquabacterium commune]|uniref:Diguanylate cyclase/phosphodiesterase n=1 Tax=Aquabacterium commune TaxID=70586 RepID=A0A4R6RN58_9BURK|nr:EAL domain-containing protein [Aquabacterium commune]TDP87982.1 diguanylate cyclase/phosphodiesterase [Aquabacterium commune]